MKQLNILEPQEARLRFDNLRRQLEAEKADAALITDNANIYYLTGRVFDGYIYVAQIAMGANPAQTLKAIQEAEAYPGPSLIIAYSPCEMHSIKGGMMNCQAEMKKAVECGYWNLFRFNPAAEGAKFTLDSKEPAGGYQEFLMNEARYSRLTREFPDRASELFQRNEKAAMDRYQHLLKLKELYAD